jgi:hypothetical protein
MSRTVQPPSFPTTFGLRAATWGDLNPQAHPSLQDAHRTEQLVASRCYTLWEVNASAQQERISELHQSWRAAHLRHQHPGAGLVELPWRDDILRRYGEGSTPPGIKQAAEERGRIKAGQAQPDQGTIPADEAGGGAIANQPMVGDWEIAIYRVER